MEERSVLEYAEVIIDRQRDKINELEKEIQEQKRHNDDFQRCIIRNEEENKALRIELNRKNDNALLLNMHMNTHNDLTKKISALENQLLKRDSLLEELNTLLRKRKLEYDQMLNENEKLRNALTTLKYELNEEKKKQKLKEEGLVAEEKNEDKLINLYKNNKEELNVTKRCLIQIEGELDMYKKQNEQQKLEIQRLHKIINCMNREKILVPPVILTTQYGGKQKTKGEHLMANKSGKNGFALTNRNLPTSNEWKSTRLIESQKYMDQLECDQNLLKMNYFQTQEEQKSIFNKILETLAILQDVKGQPQNDNDFFFSGIVLHYCKKPPMLHLMDINNLSKSYSSNSTNAYDLINDTSESASTSYLDYEEIQQNYGKKSKNPYKKPYNKKRHNYTKNKYNTPLSRKHALSGSLLNFAKIDLGYNGKMEKRKRQSHSKKNTTTDANGLLNGLKNDQIEMHTNKTMSTYKTSEDSSNSNASSFVIPSYREKSEDGSRENYSDDEEMRDSFYKNRKFLRKLEKYKDRFIGVTSQHIYIYNKMKDEEPLYIIRLQNLKSIKTMFNNKLYIIEHIPYDDTIEKHYIFIKEDDKSLRMYYALHYAGFLNQEMNGWGKLKKEIKTSTSFNSQLKDEKKKKKKKNIHFLNSKKKKKKKKKKTQFIIQKDQQPVVETTAIKADIFTPSGKDKFGNSIAYLSSDVIIKTNEQQNALIFQNLSGETYKVFENEAYLFCDNNNNNNMNNINNKENNDNKFILRFHETDTEHVIIPKNKETSDFLFHVMKQLKWKPFPVKEDVKPLKETKVEPQMSTEKEKQKTKPTSPPPPSKKTTSPVPEKVKPTTEPEPTPPPESEEEGDIFLIKDKVLYITEDGSPFTKQTNLEDDHVLKLTNDHTKIVKYDDIRDLTIIKNYKKAGQEFYVYNIADKEKYKYWIHEMKNNGFDVVDKDEYKDSKQKKGSGSIMDLNSYQSKDSSRRFAGDENQVVVIEKGILEIYKNYGTEKAEPFMKFKAETCSAETNEVNGEIRLVETKGDNKEKIVLDCLNKIEYNRWENALAFGGFLKKNIHNNTIVNLKKHIFPINLFDDFDPKNSLVKVENNFLNIYTTPNSSRPLFSFDKNKIELIIIPELRKLRIYLQRDTLYEQRFDFTITLARDFNYIKEEIEKAQFFSLNQKKTQKIKKPFVLCRRNLIVVHKDKYTLKPEMSFEKSKYTLKIDKDNLTITFLPIGKSQNIGAQEAKTLILDNSINFNKWMVTLKLACFVETQQSFYDNLNFPAICYGHTCPEAFQLIKKNIKILSFFKKKKNSNIMTDTSKESSNMFNKSTIKSEVINDTLNNKKTTENKPTEKK